MKDGWKHLYGVIKSAKDLNSGSIRIGDRDIEIYPVRHKGLAAIVSRADFIDGNSMPRELVVRRLLDHQKVIESAMGSTPIIPFKFGSLAQSEKEVEQILMEGRALFEALLPWVQERMEIELVAKWDREKIFKTLYKEEPEIQSLQKMVEERSGTDALLEKVKLGKIIQQCLFKRRALCKETILSHLRGFAESLWDHEVMDDLMILNAAFLLKKESENEFDRRVEDLDQTFLGEVSFKLIGPLPLYSFKCVEIEWADANEIRDALSTLGLKGNPPFTDVKSAYHQKAQSLHPDQAGDLSNTSSEFERVVKAYGLLRRYYRAYPSLPSEGRILLMEVKTNGTNDR